MENKTKQNRNKQAKAFIPEEGTGKCRKPESLEIPYTIGESRTIVKSPALRLRDEYHLQGQNKTTGRAPPPHHCHHSVLEVFSTNEQQSATGDGGRA